MDDKIAAFIESIRGKIGLHELNGTNRGPEIDQWADEFGTPRGSAWCALFGGHFRKLHGMWIPTHDVGSCDEWVYQAKKAGKWIETPIIGAAILYTNHKMLTEGRYAGQFDAVHLAHVVESGREVAGNTSDSEGFNRDGGCVAEKSIATKRVLGYVLP